MCIFILYCTFAGNRTSFLARYDFHLCLNSHTCNCPIQFQRQMSEKFYLIFEGIVPASECTLIKGFWLEILIHKCGRYCWSCDCQMMTLENIIIHKLRLYIYICCNSFGTKNRSYFIKKQATCGFIQDTGNSSDADSPLDEAWPKCLLSAIRHLIYKRFVRTTWVLLRRKTVVQA